MKDRIIMKAEITTTLLGNLALSLLFFRPSLPIKTIPLKCRKNGAPAQITAQSRHYYTI